MKISAIKSMINNKKYEREVKFLDKYCHLNRNLPNDVYNQLYTARQGNGLADYARSKGVTIDISDAEQKYAKDVFEFDVDERQAKRAAEGNIAITVTQLKPEKRGGVIHSLTSFISKDTKQITNRKEKDYIVIDYPSEGTQLVRHTYHEWEDNFLQTVYHSIANMANSLAGKK